MTDLHAAIRARDVARFRRHRIAVAAIRFQVLGLRGEVLATALRLVAEKTRTP